MFRRPLRRGVLGATAILAIAACNAATTTTPTASRGGLATAAAPRRNTDRAGLHRAHPECVDDGR